MTNTIKTIIRNLRRLAILWLVDALSLAAAAWILPGFAFQAVGPTPRWVVIVAAAGLLAVINFLIRPIVLLIAMPLGWIVLLVVGFLVNALALWITGWLLPGLPPGLAMPCAASSWTARRIRRWSKIPI